MFLGFYPFIHFHVYEYVNHSISCFLASFFSCMRRAREISFCLGEALICIDRSMPDEIIG